MDFRARISLNLLNEAAILAARKDAKITQYDGPDSIEKVLQLERPCHEQRNEDERGHGLPRGGARLGRASLPPLDPVQKVSIISGAGQQDIPSRRRRRIGPCVAAKNTARISP